VRPEVSPTWKAGVPGTECMQAVRADEGAAQGYSPPLTADSVTGRVGATRRPPSREWRLGGAERLRPPHRVGVLPRPGRRPPPRRPRAPVGDCRRSALAQRLGVDAVLRGCRRSASRGAGRSRRWPRFMEAVMLSAYMCTWPDTLRAARPMVWMSERAERRKPSLSASRMLTSDTSGRSRPSRSRLMPTSTSNSPRRSSRSSSTRSQRVDLGVQIAHPDAAARAGSRSGPRPSSWSGS
jgi:hypothetical protein